MDLAKTMPYSVKPVILTFIGNYLPGYKAGGILRSIVNTVEHLSDDFDFKIITRDRDIGDNKPYDGIKTHQWQCMGKAKVYYLPPRECTVKTISDLISNTKHDVLYLNSFFEPFTVKALLKRKISRTSCTQVIVAPRGEFAWASLKLKFPKKLIFILAAKVLGLYKNVLWHASSNIEASDIIKIMRINKDAIRIALDLPNKINEEDSQASAFKPPLDNESLRVVFLSRISREKNLDFALKVLSPVKGKVVFDIYGPAEDPIYWKECQGLIDSVPPNVKAAYFGPVHPDQVSHIFKRYDLCFFPSGGENYGHVIAESLMAGTPVLISDKTPWRNLSEEGLGWDIDLKQINIFIDIIEHIGSLTQSEILKNRAIVKAKILERLQNSAALAANRQLFESALLH